MDAFNSKEFYGHSLSEDPKLRTTTRNYEFKYNCSDHLEKVISRVKQDRENKKQNELLTKNCIPPGLKKLCAPYTKKNSQIFKAFSVETQIGKATSTKVSVMSDADIEAMIAQALQSSNGLAVTSEVTEGETPLEIRAKIPPQIDMKIPKCSIEFQPAIRPQWVEIKPALKANATVIELPSSSDIDLSVDMQDNSAINVANEEPANYEILVDGKSNDDRLSLNSRMSYDFVLRNDEPAHKVEIEASPLASPVSVGLDSALNDCERAEIERVIREVLPHVPEMMFGQESSESSDEKEIAEDEESQEEDAASIEESERNLEPVVRINNQECRTTKPKQGSGRSTDRSKLKSSRLSSNIPKSPNAEIHSPLKTKRPLTPNKLMQKQLEVLKQEKIRIFSKMTSIQEKIVENLDNIRINILELGLPDGQVETKIRERNAFEFSVRFSRNYLFPLGRMIEELRFAPIEEFRSATTNEACIRVCGIYGLLNQGLTSYLKQIRHFFIDSIPKKLVVLLQMIKDTTNICLQKKIFDKRDSLIQCLLLRCGTFLEFVLQFMKQKSARESEYKPMKSGRKSPYKLTRTSSKWDLTMNLNNNLSMYEPKLVPKKPKRKPLKKSVTSLNSRDKITEPTKPKVTKEQPKSRETAKANFNLRDRITAPVPDPIDTQVQKIDHSESLHLITSAIEEQPDNELTKTVIETLQDITKDEVRQMLGPLVVNLGAIFKNQDNPQTVEEMLGFLNSEFQEKCQHLKIDAAAAENSTQNSNTYQKDMPKKGVNSNSSKGEEQQPQHKDDRLKRRRISKTKTAISTHNVNEDSTERTESKNSLGGRTDSLCDKQSLSNTDVSGVTATNKSDSTKHKSPSGNVAYGRAFISPVAVAVKKHTPAPAAIRAGIQPRTPLVSTVSLAKLNEVMPPPPLAQRSKAIPKKMTSQQKCIDKSVSLPSMVPSAEKFSTECGRIEVRRHSKGRLTDIASKLKVRDGAAANAYHRGATQDNEGACQANRPPSSGAGQIEQLKYSNNALYTFVKYNDQTSRLAQNAPYEENEEEEIPHEECFIESCTRITTPKLHSRDPSFKSLDSSSKLLPLAEQQINEEAESYLDVKEILEEREHFIEQCKSDPLYANPQFPEPWKVLSKISQNIAGEIVEKFGNDLSFGEESYVQDFINMEMQT